MAKHPCIECLDFAWSRYRHSGRDNPIVCSSAACSFDNPNIAVLPAAADPHNYRMIAKLMVRLENIAAVDTIFAFVTACEHDCGAVRNPGELVYPVHELWHQFLWFPPLPPADLL